MKSTRSDGGPAYPRITDSHVDREETVYDGPEGMTLRDHFAGLAMHAALGCESAIEQLSAGSERSGLNIVEVLARAAYAQADAMLKARAA